MLECERINVKKEGLTPHLLEWVQYLGYHSWVVQGETAPAHLLDYLREKNYQLFKSLENNRPLSLFSLAHNHWF